MMTSRCLRFALVILLAGFTGLSLLADDKAADKKGKKGKDQSAKSLPIYPVGQPAKFDAGKKALYAVWHQDGTWHLRVTARKGDKEVFQGTVRVDKGRLSGRYQGLEKAKKAQNADWVVPHEDGKGFDFRFVSVGKVDSLSFKVSEAATEITFNLKVGGKELPGHVLVGAESQSPEKIPFVLPAHP